MNTTNNTENLVLRFGKALTNEPELLRPATPDPEGLKAPPLWIALGHLDTLQVYPLPASGPAGSESGERQHWLSKAYENNVEQAKHNDGRFYFHPIHATTHAPQPEYGGDFLEIPSPYLFVTLLQGRDHTQQPEGLKTQVDGYLKEKMAGHSEGHRVYYRIYYSITLSDLVILWKSDSIRGILDAIQWLYCAPMVGDLHSIPTILYASICGEKGAPAILREELPLVINRYVVQDAGLAYSFFTGFPALFDEKKTWFTIGIEDLTRVECGWTTEDLCRILRSRMQDKDYREKFQGAFLCCETHLGTPMRPVPSQAPQGKTALTERCSRLLEQYQEIVEDSKWTDELDTPWRKTAGDLFNALLDLSRNTVADGFCYLMVDAAALFCQELEKRKNKTFSDKDLEGIQRFLRGWESLTDKVLRTDGRFSQQPGFSPALCDIPSSLLEFYLAFTFQMGSAMQLDSEVPHRYSLLLAPKLCRRIKVETVFEEDPPCDRLLYVDIPIAMLYQPFEVLCHLTHEISHFSGDEWRLRELRTRKYLEICGQELGEELLFKKSATVDQIIQDLSNLPDRRLNYLSILADKVLKRIQDLLKTEQATKQWMDIEFQDLEPQKWGVRLQCDTQLHLFKEAMVRNPEKPETLFFDNMQDFKYFFKECYADVAAIFALKLNAAEYVSLNRREFRLFSRSYEKGASYYRSVERWTIVIHICFQDQTGDLFSRPPKDMEEFVKDIRQCYRFHFTADIFPDEEMDNMEKRYHRIESVCLLEEYLSSCYQKMRGSNCGAAQSGALKRLRTAFRTLARDGMDISAPACSELVHRYRQNILR